MIKQKNTLHIPPDRLQTRGDHSYSLQDAEKFRAIETLKKARLLIPFTELSTYHGRVAHVYPNLSLGASTLRTLMAEMIVEIIISMLDQPSTQEHRRTLPKCSDLQR